MLGIAATERKTWLQLACAPWGGVREEWEWLQVEEEGDARLGRLGNPDKLMQNPDQDENFKAGPSITQENMLATRVQLLSSDYYSPSHN